MVAVYHVYKLQFQTQLHCYVIAHGIVCRNSSMQLCVWKVAFLKSDHIYQFIQVDKFL